MEIRGHIHNGVVVLEGGATFPEGTRVAVFPIAPAPSEPQIVLKPGELPVVLSGAPGSIALTNERISEIVEEEDIAALKGTWNAPS